MKTSEKKVPREVFILATNIANQEFKSLHPRTKLAAYCVEFLEANKKLIKASNKAQDKLTNPFDRELRDVKIKFAVEKDGKIDFSANGGYQYDRAGEKAVVDKKEEVAIKIAEVLEPFMQELVVVKCLVDPMELPSDMDPANEKNLNGFVFQNKNPFISNDK